MKLPFSQPVPSGSARSRKAKSVRDLASEVSRLQPQALTRDNGEETDLGPPYPSNFTKGLFHNRFGLVDDAKDYRAFVEAINSEDPNFFDNHVETAQEKADSRGERLYKTTLATPAGAGTQANWRGWESPRAGHVYELQGPDAGAVGMAPAPRIGTDELAFEMAEVYALALLRDVPFSQISLGGATATPVINSLAGMSYLTVPQNDKFARARKDGRLIGGVFSPATAFRGSTPGAFAGPYISQFMLIGTDGPREQGYIRYGTLRIDQRSRVHKEGLDYMTDWDSWLDVQNGANFRNQDDYEPGTRFITTPRDLATYVHFDELYEAYLNAALIMLARGVPTSRGFPETSPAAKRTGFATFGGPHILSLVTEVATRCLKAVRRQKFNYHRRCRPEAIGGRLTLVNSHLAEKLGPSRNAFAKTFADIPDYIRTAIDAHNGAQNNMAGRKILPPQIGSGGFINQNLLLPMAFPEGSPMHPAYGAGHATVAGGCVTMLKAFFEMFKDGFNSQEREFYGPNDTLAYIPGPLGNTLIDDPNNADVLTIQGELDKLAANIAIGRNMAGVHYHSDYFDSVRMGERIAVGILMEQAPTYGEVVEMTFTSFDGDHIAISGNAFSCPSLSVIDKTGNPVSPEEWWLRHVPGQEMTQDLTLSA